MKSYDPKKIEKKWQNFWEKKKIHQASDSSKKKKYYCLVEFPYPSGDGLHVGHVRSYTALDIVARKKRMEGFNVLYPMGWDAFGLPAENYAIKTKIHPSITTKKNIANFKKQMKSIGLSFDWSREINTTDPKYYKWTQWIFLQLLKHNLAYKARIPINWCPKDKIGLANEEVVDGKCERCGTQVEKREKEQWMLAITKYAERLDKDLDSVDYLSKIKLQQRNWIGKSEGAEIDFSIQGGDEKITVFTTRPDTIFGATYVVLSPEHTLIKNLQSKIKNIDEVKKYIHLTKGKTEIERTAEKKEKTGVLLQGIKAINPATKEPIPVWVADYVLGNYGTGALMAVPAHDERDFEFAKKHKLPIREVVVPNIVDERNPPVPGKKFVERRNVHPIIRDPKTGKYLALKWKKFPWVTFPMGGIDDGEDVVVAARREVEEETGFTNLKLIKVIPGTVRAEYFAAHKDENRIAYTTAVVFDLIDDTQVAVDEKEKEAHEILWLNRSELNYKNMTHAEVDIWNERLDSGTRVYSGYGYITNAGSHGGQFEGKDSQNVMRDITTTFGGKWVTKYKLRDWVFSRQRYWGEPIPVIHCEKCGVVPVPEKDLPVKLPNVKNYEPTDTGESPLATISSWVNTKCPQCKGSAKRETDVMPNWAGSSWYFLRYIDPKNSKVFADKNKTKKWLPVDWYNGGMEHTTLHLLYSRFWNKFLFDLKLVPSAEPYQKRTSHGLILAQGGEKMSKSKGNVVNPDDIILKYGADTLRVYEMFIGPFDQSAAWSTDGIIGPLRFLEKIWRVAQAVSLKKENKKNETLEVLLHKTIDKVGRDIDGMNFNTAVSTLMIFVNECEKQQNVPRQIFLDFLKILAPFAPHLCEELRSSLGNKNSIHQEVWPKVNLKKIASQKVTIAIQINGKIRATLEAEADASQEDIKEQILGLPEVQKWLQGKAIRKEIYVPGRIFNLVIG